MKRNKIKVLTLLIVLSMVFSLLICSATCYAEVDKRDKDQVTSQNRPAYIEGEFLIKFKDGTSSAEKSSIASANGLEHIKSFESLNMGLYSVNGNSRMKKALKVLDSDEEVEFIQPNYLYYPAEVDDTDYNKQWGLNNTGQSVNGSVGTADVDIDAPEAWSVTQGAEDTIVAVIDTGIDINHPELRDRMWTNPGEIAGNGIDDDGNKYIDDIYGWDFYNDDSTVFDIKVHDDHGTHVAGIIAAEANTSGVIGVAPGVKIMSLKFIGPESGSTADAIEAIEYAKLMGVKLSNNSWSGSPQNKANLDQDLKYAVENSGMLFVAAAGNHGVNIDADGYFVEPAAYDGTNVLTVAAAISNVTLSGFSNYGRTSVDIAAPGKTFTVTVSEVAEGTAAISSIWHILIQRHIMLLLLPSVWKTLRALQRLYSCCLRH